MRRLRRRYGHGRKKNIRRGYKGPTYTYSVHGLDVWGNKKDGYEVNDVYPSSGTITIPVDATNDEIIAALKKEGFIDRNIRASSIEIDGEVENTMDYNYEPKNHPEYELSRKYLALRRLRRRYGRAAKASDKARWEKLRAQFIAAHEAAREQEINMRVKYGDANWRHWASKGDRNKLDKLQDRASKIGDKLLEILYRVSPRGDAWRTGAPVYWIYEKLSWEDAIRPVNEPLSVVVPAPYGANRGLT